MDQKKSHQQIDQTPLILKQIIRIKKDLKKSKFKNPTDWHELAICYYSIGNRRQAIHYLDLLLQEFPDYIEVAAVKALQALCLIEMGKFEKAKQIIENRAARDKIDTRLIAMLAYIYEKTDQREKSIHCLKQILNVDPENINAHNSLGYLLTLQGNAEDSQYALECLYKVLVTNSTYPAYLDSIGVYYAKHGDKKRAREAFHKALSIQPENLEILEHIQEFLN